MAIPASLEDFQLSSEHHFEYVGQQVVLYIQLLIEFLQYCSDFFHV